MKRSQLLLASLIVIVALLLAACGGGTEAASDDGSQSAPAETPSAATDAPAATDDGGAASGSFSLDPATAGSGASEAAGALYETLVNASGEGVLAESYTVSEDELDYIFNLRPGVTFHDGSALTADVVIANFNRWFDPEDANRGSGDYSAWADNFGGFKGEVNEDGTPKSGYDGIEKVNDLIVLVHLNRVDADFISKLSNSAFSIVSADAFGGDVDGGSGPYQLGETSGSSATLEPFPGYWNAEAIPSGSMDVTLE